MENYNVQNESKRILTDVILTDSRLGFTEDVKAACKQVKFLGESKPYLPTPLKMTESAAALQGLAGALAATVVADRYGVKQDVTLNTDMATLYLMGVLLPTIDGVSVAKVESAKTIIDKADLGVMFKPIHQAATNIYKTKDGRFYHSHGSMDAAATMKMLEILEQDVTHEQAQKIYADKIAGWDAEKIDLVANEEFRQAGTICYTPDEYLATPQGKLMADEPLATITPLPAPKKAWPSVHNPDLRPLAGIRIIDCSRAVAAPAISKLLAVLGADVIRISHVKLPETAFAIVDMNTGKRDIDIDLKSAEGRAKFVELVKGADVLVNGFRPNAIEKLGLDSASLRKINPSLIYVRENCYGWKGPWSHRSGWQQIADCVAGTAYLQGYFMGLDEPIMPLLPNSDYQAGIVGAVMIIQTLKRRAMENKTFNIDISLTAYNLWLHRLGLFERGQAAAILARTPEFQCRYNDDMLVMFQKVPASINESLPGMIQTPEFYFPMSGKHWGQEKDIMILRAPFKLSKSKVSYLEPSGARGWSNNDADWRPLA